MNCLAIGALLFCAATLSAIDTGLSAIDTGADKMTGQEAGQLRDDNALRMSFIWCPAGTFTPENHTGNEDRRTELTDGFWLGKNEITQSEWSSVMATKPWVGWARVRIGDDVAATYVTWDDATAFCAKLTERERAAGRLRAGWEYTLPTESQWEHACRAQTTTTFSFGDDDTQLYQYAWYSPKRQSTLPGYRADQGQLRVGQLKPNLWGLHDMHGNVWEWCRDGYVDNPPAGRDPMTKPADSFRVIRGGSWWNGAYECRSARRDKQQIDHSDYSLGFRVALGRIRANTWTSRLDRIKPVFATNSTSAIHNRGLYVRPGFGTRCDCAPHAVGRHRA